MAQSHREMVNGRCAFGAVEVTGVISARTKPVTVIGSHYSSAVWRAVTSNFPAAVGSALATGVLLASVVFGAEPEPSARVAILNTTSPLRTAVVTTSFLAELQRLGYVKGRNLTIDSFSAEDKPDRLADLAQALVRQKPDVIVTIGTQESTVAAMKATTTIPIFFIHTVDPVRAGLVASLAKPGGNVTGVTSLNADLGAKRLDLITEIAPSVRRVAVLVSPADSGTPSMVGPLKSTARARLIRLDIVEIRDPSRLGDAVSDAARAGAGALLVLSSPSLYGLSASLAELAAKYRLPTMSAWRAFPEASGLASYGTPLPEMAKRAAGQVDRILRGAKPSELPVEQPTKFELVINLKTAKGLGLTVPESVMLQADEVIR